LPMRPTSCTLFFIVVIIVLGVGLLLYGLRDRPCGSKANCTGRPESYERHLQPFIVVCPRLLDGLHHPNERLTQRLRSTFAPA
jgi:hypothetical protein